VEFRVGNCLLPTVAKPAQQQRIRNQIGRVVIRITISPAERWSDFIGLVTICGAPGTLASGGFGFARYTPATFDVFYWLQVTNYGVLYFLFDSAPSGSNDIDVWDLSLHLQMASPDYFVATF